MSFLSALGSAKLRYGHVHCYGRCFHKLYTTVSSSRVSEEVREAVQSKRPVVALESTIYTHGLPMPQSLDLAKRLDYVVRENGGIPAPVGVLEGVARVGLSISELEDLLQRPGNRKISRRDLGFALSPTHSRVSGGTTVAGTMILAHLAGIKVFATGGLGGVHRGGQDSFDVSADLTELGRTPVAVVSSGCKGFLDIPRTLEYLETQGVGVATFKDGREGDVDFPAFWSRDSGCKSPMSLVDEVEAAGVIHAQSRLPLSSGLLLANPVSSDSAIPLEELDSIITEAIQAAESSGAAGSKYTPHVLDSIRVLSGGRSVEANRALVESNVRRGTRVAVALSKLECGASSGPLSKDYSASVPGSASMPPQAYPEHTSPEALVSASPSTADILVAGSIALDTTCTLIHNITRTSEERDSDKSKREPNQENTSNLNDATTAEYANESESESECEFAAEPEPCTSNPSATTQTPGGVGLNIARSAAVAGARVKFFTLVGDDFSKTSLPHEVRGFEDETSGGLECELERVTGGKTASYVGFNDAHGELWCGMGDMRIFEGKIERDVGGVVAGFKTRTPFRDSIGGGSERSPDARPHSTNPQPTRKQWLITDSNWSPRTLHRWLTSARSSHLHTAYEPVSDEKSTRIFDTLAFTPTGPSSSRLAPPLIPLADLATPNIHELNAMYRAVHRPGPPTNRENPTNPTLTGPTTATTINQETLSRAHALLPYIPNLAIKLGRRGVLFVRLLHENDGMLHSPHTQHSDTRQNPGERRVAGVYARLFPPPRVLRRPDVVSVNGAGDTFVGVLVAGLVEGGSFEEMTEGRLEKVVMRAQRASAVTLGCFGSVGVGIERVGG